VKLVIFKDIIINVNISAKSYLIDYQSGRVWLKCKYSPQSAVEGRLYLISKQEADTLDEQLDSKQMVSAFSTGFYKEK